MSIQLKYLTCEKLKINSIRCVPYLCDDMSMKNKDRTYSMSSTKDKKRAYRALVDEELEGFSKLYDGIDMVQLFSSLREYMEPAYMDRKDD